MERTETLKAKLQSGQICYGTGISFIDSAVTEAMSGMFDFVWIDMEHSAFSLETVQAHVMATKGTNATPIVRVPWNDPVLIKPVLDLGAAGIIAPQVRTAAEASNLVAACLYPPEGIRGFGPRRPSDYGRKGGPDFCRAQNEAIMTIAQIEHIDAVRNLDEILAVPGLTSIVLGPNDLAGSMGHSGNARHKDVLHAIDTVIEKALRTQVFIGVSGGDVEALADWMAKGAQWASIANDFLLMLAGSERAVDLLRKRNVGEPAVR